MILIIGNNSIAAACGRLYSGRSRIIVPPTVLNGNSDFSLDEVLGAVPAGIVINCWEFGGLDRAEYEREEAYNINAFAVKELASCCAERGHLLAHVSTSCVFNGLKSSPYTEEDEPDPVSFFGDSKLLGEVFIRESGCRHLIVRAADIYGADSLPRGLDFAKAAGEGFEILKGQRIAPAPDRELARALKALLDVQAEGLFHFSPAGSTTPADFFSVCARFLAGLPSEPKWTELDLGSFIAPGERLLMNVLDPSLLLRTASLAPLDWESALHEFFRENRGSFSPAEG